MVTTGNYSNDEFDFVALEQELYYVGTNKSLRKKVLTDVAQVPEVLQQYIVVSTARWPRYPSTMCGME